MELSKRLQAVADLVSPGLTVADVGTDHGYIPIYLTLTGKSPKVIAMDIKEGPLQRAKDHIAAYDLQDKIETRLSNGVERLAPNEFECVVIAGMGGALAVQIMEEGEEVFKNLKEFVLQPQSELYKVRKYLKDHSYKIVAENMVLEEGKYYPMMRVIQGEDGDYTDVELLYGKYLLQEKNSILKSFLEKERGTKRLILEKLNQEHGDHIEMRKSELEEELRRIEYALQRYY